MYVMMDMQRLDVTLLLLLDGHGHLDSVEFFRHYFPVCLQKRIDFLMNPRCAELMKRLDPSSVIESSEEGDSVAQFVDITPFDLNAILYGAIMDVEAMHLAKSRIYKSINMSGACLVAALVTDEYLVYANVGDCRVCLVQTDRSKSISVDHTPFLDSECIRVKRALKDHPRLPLYPSISVLKHCMAQTRFEYRDMMTQDVDARLKQIMTTMPRRIDEPYDDRDREDLARALELPISLVKQMHTRVQGTLAITRALGNAFLKDPKCTVHPDVAGCGVIATPYLYTHILDPVKDVALVLMTDGITDAVDADMVI